MMTVLNTIEIMEPHPIGIYLILLAFVCLITCLVICFVRIDWTHVIITLICFGIGFGVVGLGALIIAPEVPTGKFQIEATFTDDFPFTSVMKEYDVIEQRGDIFLLEPKVEID